MKKILFLLVFIFIQSCCSDDENSIQSISVCTTQELGLTTNNKNPVYPQPNVLDISSYSIWKHYFSNGKLTVYRDYRSGLSGGSSKLSYNFNISPSGCLIPLNRFYSEDLCEYLGDWNGIYNDPIYILKVQHFTPGVLLACEITTLVNLQSDFTSTTVIDKIWVELN